MNETNLDDRWRDGGAVARSAAPRPALRRVYLAITAIVGATWLGAAEVIPPPPPAYFNDFAGVVSPATAQQLNAELAQFERDTSNQIVVAVYPHMQSDSSLDDYATQLYEAWHLGQKGRDNGALLLVFTQDHQMRIQTGYGLEAALPDVLCSRIINDEIAPRFRQGDIAGGLSAGVHAMLAAARGEYRGTGRTVRENNASAHGGLPVIPIIFFGLIVLISIIGRQSSRSSVYGRRGRSTWLDTPWWIGGGGSGGGGWSGGGGGGGWGGGGGFSGGGGSTGGGGASGSW